MSRPGADPGFRRGGFVQEFQERIQIVAGSWANQQAKQNCRQPWGGGSDDPQKNPVSAHDDCMLTVRPCCHCLPILCVSNYSTRALPSLHPGGFNELV